MATKNIKNIPLGPPFFSVKTNMKDNILNVKILQNYHVAKPFYDY